MAKTYKAAEVKIGYHPDGYRIGRTTSPINFYTQWQISEDVTWYDPKPVDFDVFPEYGWMKCEGFNWEQEK